MIYCFFSKKSLIFSFFILFLSLSSCREDLHSLEDDSYSALKYYLGRDSAPCFCNRFPLASQEIDKFTYYIEDSVMLLRESFIEKDLKDDLGRKNSVPTQDLTDKNINQLRNIIPIDSIRYLLKTKELWKYLKNNYDVDGVSTISIPRISKDKTKAIFKVETYLESGSYGAIYILRKNKGAWDVFDQYQMWED